MRRLFLYLLILAGVGALAGCNIDDPIHGPLKLSAESLEFDFNESAPKTITISCDGDQCVNFWVNSSCSQWITVVKESNSVMTVKVADNPDGKERTGRITFVPEKTGLETKTITVRQRACTY